LTCLSKFYMKNAIRKILITGVSGMLGSNLAYYFKDNYDILGLYNTHPVEIKGIHIQQADILSVDSLKNVIQDYKPDIIIHCASLTDIEYCETRKEKTDLVNVIGTKNIVDSVNNVNTKIIYISSDSVYEGVAGNFSETDPVIPQNYYGLTKYKGELEVLKRSNSLILRTNIFGWNVQDKFSIAEWILHELTEKTQINGFKDVYFSSIYTFDLAKILEKAIEQDLAGIYNCGSSDSISKYEFARLLATRFNLDEKLIHPISIDDFKFKAKRGKNLSLNVSKLTNALSCNLPRIHDTVEAFYQDFIDGLPGKMEKQMLSGMETQPFLNYGKQSIDEDDIQAVVEVLKSTNLTQGPKVAEFEEALCRYTGARFAVACNSGTSALHMACLAAGVQPGDEVITSPITFVASANCVVYCGARPVFADIDPLTYNLSPSELEKKITSNTRAIIPVHFAGQSCDMAAIKQIKEEAEKRYNCKICLVEDASHALGSLYKGSKVGSCIFSDMTVTSFHPVKHITTGEGGVVFTNDEILHSKLRKLRSHGITSDQSEFLNHDLAFQPPQTGGSKMANPWYYEQITLGYNYRITDIQCALGLSQLKKLEAFKKRRREIVKTYDGDFRNLKHVKTPFETTDCDSNFHLYVLLFDFEEISMDRATFITKLKEKGIQTQVHYIPVHLQPFYRKYFGTNRGDCPIAEEYYTKCLSIPLHPSLTDRDVERVINEIKNLIGK
jgi:perosamine synthetase